MAERLLKLAASILSALALASCSGSSFHEEVSQFPTFGPRDPHVSPFQIRKVNLSVADLSPDENEGATPLPITVVVDNVCAERECTEESERLSCQLFQGPERHAQKTQYYTYPPPADLSLSELTRWANSDACVVGVAAQKKYKSSAYNDPLYAAQRTYLNTIKNEESIPLFPADLLAPVKVAIIDTGVGVHPDLGTAAELPGIFSREDLRSGSNRLVSCPTPYTNNAPNNPHGTFIAGIIGGKANNSLGIAGIAQNSQILSIAIGDCTGSFSSAEIGNALISAAEQGAEVVNLSLGGEHPEDAGVQHAVVTLLNVHKATIVISAGNDYKDIRTHSVYPARYGGIYRGVLTVAWGTTDGRLNEGNGLTWGSNYSPEHVKLLAPGTSIISTVIPEATYSPVPGFPGYASGQGSSFSAPMVSAAAALTIGFLKKHGMDYDERLIEYMLTEKGATRVESQVPFVKNGKVLDLKKLADALHFLKTTGVTPVEMTVSGKTTTIVNGAPQINFTTGWDLEATHFGARIGLFDAGCGYSAPCLMQDYELSGNSGSKNFSLTRNELIPMLAAPSDPNFNVYVNVAIYYRRPVPGAPGSYYNVYGTDSFVRVNVRDFDLNLPSAKFLGNVSNVRMDMQHVYVQGWSCLEGSNKAVQVELVDSSGNAIPTDFGYQYPWMVPHGSPIDGYKFGYEPGPFVALDIEMVHKNQNNFKAGWEANPLMVQECQVLTVAHGFEFGIPFPTIVARNLMNQKFRVRATHPKNSATKIFLKDDLGNEEFTVPDVNYQPSLTSNVSLQRANDNIDFTGTVCSKSPSPISVEMSFNHWDLRCRLNRKAGFPDYNDPCQLGRFHDGLPLLNDPSQPNRNSFAEYYEKYWENNATHRELTTFPLSPLEHARHIAKYPGLWPNAAVSIYPLNSSVFRQDIIARGFREVATGHPIAQIQEQTVPIVDHGSGVSPLIEAYLLDRSGASTFGSQFWDYYDVGEGYTPSIVAYSLDQTKPIGELLFRNHGVRKIMREVKKFETPLSTYTQVLDHDSLTTRAPGGSACPHRFTMNKTINGMTQFRPAMKAYLLAYLKQGESPMTNIAIDDPDESMKTVPVDIRFFQDGVMILHLLSDYGTATSRVPGFR